MHFNIYLDDTTGQQLNTMAQRVGESRNALIRQAVSQWLVQQAQTGWPDAVLNFKGLGDTPPFETSRDQLALPAEDPLA